MNPTVEEGARSTRPLLRLGVSYYGNRIPWRVQEDLKVIRDAGCAFVVHTFSEEDLEFYRDALAEIVAETHAFGMEAWLDPWGVGQLFGGETYSSLIAKDLALRQIDSRGASLPIACPNHPALREYLVKWIEAAKGVGADWLFWDEPHFFIYPEPEGDQIPKLWACRCPTCQELFQKAHGLPMPQELTGEVRAFKEDSLVEFIRFLCDETAKPSPGGEVGLKAAVCLLPLENSSTVNDWSRVASIPSLSVISTDPYWRPHQPEVGSFVGRFARRISTLSAQHGKEGQLWILNFNIPKGEEETIRIALEAGFREGIRNFAAWSYYGAAYIRLKAEDPEAVWKTLCEAYRELREREAR